jgi:AhpD family alkylhydroperoxidase
MQERLNYRKHYAELADALVKMSQQLRTTGLEESLLELVRLRASQINGCAYCVDMHTKDARAAGESEQRLYAVAVWEEAPFFTPRERAALVWTEALTLIADNRVPDELYEEVREHFSESELVALTWAVNIINCWNRLAVSFRATVGNYQPRKGGSGRSVVA